ncbi:MAG TPA: YHS domain-containing protein [Thermoanaerobaculia bacterium]|nr:YHS domain-containing protein [Thermoanaerobaculia bacterium]
MRRLLVLAAVLAAACDSTPAKRTPAQQAQAEMRTINNVQPQPAKLESPPMLTDEAPPPKPKALPWETPTPIVFSPEDEKLRASLPFTPAIAMDPIDGSKLSIRATTPTFEYKGKIYYFSSQENLSTFKANPDQYLTGRFTRL